MNPYEQANNTFYWREEQERKSLWVILIFVCTKPYCPQTGRRGEKQLFSNFSCRFLPKKSLPFPRKLIQQQKHHFDWATAWDSLYILIIHMKFCLESDANQVCRVSSLKIKLVTGLKLNPLLSAVSAEVRFQHVDAGGKSPLWLCITFCYRALHFAEWAILLHFCAAKDPFGFSSSKSCLLFLSPFS